MKKNLILPLLMLVGLAACKKESKKTTTNLNSQVLEAKHLSLAPAYTDMTLNSDGSYSGYWNDCLIRVTNPAWDQVKYPNLVNGVPVMVGGISTTDGTSSVDAANTGNDGNVFQVTQIYASLTTFNSDAFNSDLSNYTSAIQTWMSDGGTRPNIDNYLKDSYTMNVGTNQVKTYTGKFIRVTTGSNLAIATLSYPLPTAGTVSNSLPGGSIYDSSYNQNYNVQGSNNELTSAVCNTVHRPITGTYKLGSGGVYTLVGTIIRADGTKFEFNTTIAP